MTGEVVRHFISFLSGFDVPDLMCVSGVAANGKGEPMNSHTRPHFSLSSPSDSSRWKIHENHSGEKENKIENKFRDPTSLLMEGEKAPPFLQQFLLTPTSYRGGYLFLLLSAQHNHFSKTLKIHKIHAATSTHLALSLQHITSQRYCLLILDLVPTHIQTPSYVEIKRFLVRFCNGSNPTLNHTLVHYPNSIPITVQFISPPTEVKLGTALLIGTKLGTIQFYSFQLLEWEWKALESFNLLQTQDQILGIGHKTLQSLTYHPSTLTLTWMELDDRNNCLFVRCCQLPSPLCPHVSGAPTISHVNSYCPENFISTLYHLNHRNRSYQFCHLESSPSPPSAVASWLFSTQPQVLQEPPIAAAESPESLSLVSSLSSPMSSRSFLDNQLIELKLRESGIEGFYVTAIDFRKSRLTPTTIPLPSLDEEFSLVSLTSTNLPSSWGEMKDRMERCLVILQLEIHSTKERRCFLYQLNYSTSGSIEHFGPHPLHYSSPDLLSSCSIDDNTLFLLHNSSATVTGRQQSSLFYASLGALLRFIHDPSSTTSVSIEKWSHTSSLRGEVIGLIHSQPDTEWMIEVKRHFCQPLFKICLYTSHGELLEVKVRESISTQGSFQKLTQSQTPKYSLRDLTEKLFLTNSLINPTASSLSDLIGTGPLYCPHSWCQCPPLAHDVDDKEIHRKESFLNSIFTYSNVGVLPPHHTLRDLWNRRADLELRHIEVPGFSPISSSFTSLLSNSLLLDHLLFTLFTSDARHLILSCDTPIPSPPTTQHPSLAPLANYFIDIDRFPLKESHTSESSSPVVFTVRYLDIQELFISCQRSQESGAEELEEVIKDYLELCLWYLTSFHPSSLANFVYQILVLLSSRPRPDLPRSRGLISAYDSLNKLNRYQRLVLLRSITSLESWWSFGNIERMGGLDDRSSCLPPEQQLYLTICSFAQDGALQIVKTLCQWNCWEFVVDFSCRILTEYNTSRVREMLGERWNNYSPEDQQDQRRVMRWDNPFDDDDLDEDDGSVEREEKEATDIGEGEEVGCDGDWGNTWQDASGSETDTTEKQPQEGDDSVSLMGDCVVWNDVESDDEEESDDLCWKNFAKYSRSVFLICLRGLLISGEVKLACRLISCRPQCPSSPSHRSIGNHQSDQIDRKGISDLDIIQVFEEIYEQQQQQQSQPLPHSLSSPTPSAVLTSDDLRNCINSLTYGDAVVVPEPQGKHQLESRDTLSEQVEVAEQRDAICYHFTRC